jgi:hypothetical protein
MIVKCENCGREFYKKDADIKRTKHNLCSKKCVGEQRKRINDERFFKKATRNKTTECLEWKNKKNKFNYGVVRHNGRPMLAHRVAYMISHPDENIDNLHVLHKCDNPSCINPDHLFIGTHADNMADMQSKMRGNRKVNYDELLKIRNSKECNRALSKKYDVSERTIRRIRHKDKNGAYKYYKHWRPQPPKEVK